ncbi:hypothetical protein, partial [Haloferax sp. Atlit-19N]|uniref:hypothetical protein n=1 Tax=Haloferax sp. Atlit-19N TaxID=2077201 RepID=UPI001F44962C
QPPLSLVVDRIEVSRFDVPHLVAAETVKREVEGNTSTWVLVLDEGEEFLLFVLGEPQSLSRLRWIWASLHGSSSGR